MSKSNALKTQILEEYYSQPHYRGLQADLSRKYNIGQTTLSSWIKQKKGVKIDLGNNFYLTGIDYLADPELQKKAVFEYREKALRRCQSLEEIKNQVSPTVAKLDPEFITIEKRVIMMAAFILAIGLISLILFVFFSIFFK